MLYSIQCGPRAYDTLHRPFIFVSLCFDGVMISAQNVGMGKSKVRSVACKKRKDNVVLVPAGPGKERLGRWMG